MSVSFGVSCFIYPPIHGRARATLIFTLTFTLYMSQKRIIRIGLLGFGVVGQGVWKNIENNRQALEFRLGAQLDITEVVVKNLTTKREVVVPPES